MNEDEFYEYFNKFICTDGKEFLPSVKFYQEIDCEKIINVHQLNSSNTPKILAMTFSYNHRMYENSEENIKAMNSVKDIVKSCTDLGTDGRLFAHSIQYSEFFTMEIFTNELSRNIFLALICIFLVTLFLLSDIIASLMVVGSVIMTMTNVGGFMYFWGLTIETVSSLCLIVITWNLNTHSF